jgi:uncharacterized protein (DUF1778 family)
MDELIVTYFSVAPADFDAMLAAINEPPREMPKLRQLFEQPSPFKEQ